MAASEHPQGTNTETRPERHDIMQSLTALCVRYVERLMPDPYLFAVIPTLIVASPKRPSSNAPSSKSPASRRTGAGHEQPVHGARASLLRNYCEFLQLQTSQEHTR